MKASPTSRLLRRLPRRCWTPSSSSSSSSSRLFSPYVGLVPTAHQSFPWNPGRKPCSSALNRSRAKDEKLGSCGGFFRSTTLTPDSPVSTPSALSSGYAYASPSRTPAPADDRCVNSSALSSQLPWKNTVRANWSNCADVRLFPRKPALSSFRQREERPEKVAHLLDPERHQQLHPELVEPNLSAWLISPEHVPATVRSLHRPARL